MACSVSSLVVMPPAVMPQLVVMPQPLVAMRLEATVAASLVVFWED